MEWCVEAEEWGGSEERENDDDDVDADELNIPTLVECSTKEEERLEEGWGMSKREEVVVCLDVDGGFATDCDGRTFSASRRFLRLKKLEQKPFSKFHSRTLII